MHRRVLLLTLLLAFFACFAVAQQKVGRVKLIHAYYENQQTVNITVSVNGFLLKTFINVPYKGSTDWFYMPSGTYTIGVTAGSTTVLSKKIPINSISIVAAIAMNLGVPSIVLAGDDLTSVDPGTVHVSVAHYGMSFTNGLDVGTSESTSILGQNLAYLDFSDPSTTIDAGSITIEVRNTGDIGSPLFSLPVTFEPRKHYLVMIVGNNGNTPAPELVVYELADFSVNARLAFVHGIPGESPVKVVADALTLFRNINFKGFTEYKNIPAGTQTITVLTNTSNILVSATAFFNGFSESTFYALFNDGAYANLIADNNAAPASDGARLRVMHGAFPFSLDIFADDRQIITALISTYPSAYVPLTAATYAIAMRDSYGNFAVNTTLTVAAGAVYTVLIVGDPARTGDEGFALIVMTNAKYGDNGNLRTVHAIAGGNNVDVKSGDTTLFSNVAFGGVSSYASVAAGLYRVVVVTASGNVELFRSPVRVDAGGYFTAVAGSVEEGIFQLRDDNTRPASTTANLRVVHASSSTEEVNIEFGGSVVGSLIFSEVFGYTPVPEGSYVARVLYKSDNTQVLNASLTLEADTVVSAFAMGVGSSFTIVPAIDFDYRTPVAAPSDANTAPTAPVASTPTAANTPTRTPTRVSSASVVTVSASLMMLAALL